MEPDIWATKCFYVFNSSGQRKDRYACKTIPRKFIPEVLSNFFQCHKRCWSPSVIGTCSTRWKFLLFCSSQNYMDGFYFCVADTTYCILSVHFPLPPPHSFSECRTPILLQRILINGSTSAIAISFPLACDWSRDGHLPQFTQWDVNRPLVGGAFKKWLPSW